MTDANDRLDSWKAIADYLGRDVRTLRRWEEQGLPVHRVGGGRGSSVFAFKSELDTWFKTHAERAVEPTPTPPAAEALNAAPRLPQQSPLAPAPAARPVNTRTSTRFRWAVASLLVAIAIVGWKAWAPSAARQRVVATMTRQGLVARDANGREQWRDDVPGDTVAVLPYLNPGAFVLDGPRPAVLSMTSYYLRKSDETPLSGELRQFSLDGRPQARFSLDDTWTFASKTYSGPWAMTDLRIDESYGRRQIAISAHHFTWWPSIVTVLDERFQRQGTFVNSGWVETIRWLGPDQLGISGFNQALDGGMFAVLDAHGIDGTSPEADGSPYQCRNCRSGQPLFYAVFPRSELNRLTGAPFNRATLEINGHGLIAHTAEIEQEIGGGLTEALYEFSPSHELVSATYGSRYWDKHRALELAGKIAHTRENCPDRGGPPFVWIWNRDAGWKKIVTSRSFPP